MTTLRTLSTTLFLKLWPKGLEVLARENPSHPGLSRRDFLRGTGATVAGLALSRISHANQSVDVENSSIPESRQALSRENIGKLALDSLTKLSKLQPQYRKKESSNIEWNNLITLFALSQEIDLPHVDKIREYILENGGHDSSIPIDVVDSAISTVHDWSENITGMDVLERREKIYGLLKPYTGKYITDVNEERKLESSFPRGKSSTDFVDPSHTNYAISAVIPRDELRDLKLDKDTQDILIHYTEREQLPETIMGDMSLQYSLDQIENMHDQPEEIKLFHAKNLLLLSLYGNANVLDLCKKWFETKKSSPSPYADLIVLRAVATMAQADDEAFQALKEIGEKHQNIFFHKAYFPAHEADECGYNTEAGDAITEAFERHPEESKFFIKELTESLPKGSRIGTLLTLGIMNDNSTATDTLRHILGNEKYTNEEQVSAMVGLVKARDEKSIPVLLDIASDNELPEKLREKALISIMFIDSKDPIPRSFREQYANSSPFGLDFSIVDDFLSINQISPPLIRGQAIPGVSIEETVIGTVRELDYRTTLSNGYLEKLSGENRERLNKLTDLYLRTTPTALDLPLAIPVMKILSASKHAPASQDLIEISTQPEKFLENTPKDNVYNNLTNPSSSKEPSANAILLREVATLFLGKFANPSEANDEVFNSLFITAKDDDLLFRRRAYQAINHMAREFKSDIASPHVKKVLELLESFLEERGTAFRSRKTDFRDDLNALFLLLDSLCKLGGENEVLRIAEKHASLKKLISTILNLNGKNDPFKLAYTPLPRKNNVKVAMIDGGPVMLRNEELQSTTTNPKRFSSSRKPESQFAAHANTVRRLIDGEITAYSYDKTERFSRFKLRSIQEAGYLSMLDVIANNLKEGSVPFDILSQSRGVKTRHLEKAETRKLVDLGNSAFTFLNEVGVLCLNTPGNDGGSKHGNYSGDLGSFSALGLRIRGRNNYEIPPNLLFVNVSDPFSTTQTLAPFASKTNPHGKLIIPMIMTDGISILDWYNGHRVDTATSFSLPQYTNRLSAWVSERREKGLPDIHPKELVTILSKSIGPNLDLAVDIFPRENISSR